MVGVACMWRSVSDLCLFFFFFNATATTDIYTLSLHDALPISGNPDGFDRRGVRQTQPARAVRQIGDHQGRHRARQERGNRFHYTPLSPSERTQLKEGIDESYRDFVTKVADARHGKFEEVEPLAKGRVWLG